MAIFPFPLPCLSPKLALFGYSSTLGLKCLFRCPRSPTPTDESVSPASLALRAAAALPDVLAHETLLSAWGAALFCSRPFSPVTHEQETAGLASSDRTHCFISFHSCAIAQTVKFHMLVNSF